MITITHAIIAGGPDGKEPFMNQGGFSAVLSLPVFRPVGLVLTVAVGIVMAPLTALNGCYKKLSGQRS